MAAVLERHVRRSDAELHSEEEVDESDGGEDLEGSDDDGGSEGEEESAGDQVEDEDEAGDPVEDREEDGDANANAGWAEAMAKILGKSTAPNQGSILQKNKDLQKVKEKEREEQLEKRKQLDLKRSWEMLSRVKPDVVKDKEAEKSLQRIATRGVVQLFNAVKKHQKSMEEKVKEVGGSERKKAKILSSVSKKDFIDVLRRTEEGAAKSIKKEKTEEEEEAPAWSVLREDFMMGASMKDWDKESDGEEEEAGDERGAREEESESD